MKPGDEVWVKCKVVNAEKDFDVVWPLLLSTAETDSTVLANYEEVIPVTSFYDWGRTNVSPNPNDPYIMRVFVGKYGKYYFPRDKSIEVVKEDIVAAYFALEWLKGKNEDSGEGS